MAKNDKKKKTTTALLKPGVESKSAFTKVSPSSLAKSTGTTTTTVKSGGKTTTKTTRTTTGGQSVTKRQPKVNSKSAAQVKKEKTAQKAKKQQDTASYMGLSPSNLSPLNALRRDALTGTTTRDKITYAKTTGLGKKTVGYNERSKAIKEKQDTKSKKNKEQTLSEHDSKLSSRDQNLIRDAKTDWDLAKEAGDQTGMDRAHKRAEKVRQRSGYSGGLSGSKYESPELTTEEKAKLNEQGEIALKTQKMRMEKAQREGNEDEFKEAEARIVQIFHDNAYLDRAHKRAEKVSGHGTSMDVGATETLEEFGENANSFAQAATAGVLGAIPALVETSAKATDNLTRKNNKADLEKWANNLDHYEFLLSQVKAGNRVDGETESSLEQKVRIAKNAKELLKSRTTVDSSAPGQSMLRKSAEETAKYMDGKTGVDRLLASAGLSIAQMAPALAAGALVPGAGAAVATGIMSAQAAGQKAYELNERNVDPVEAQTRGIVSGAIEALTEKIPVESLLKVVKAGGGSSMIRNIAKQAGLEATEESASYALNYLADKAAKDPEAKFSMKELAESAAVGAISGGALAGGGTVLNRVVGNSATARERTPSKVEQLAASAAQKVKESGKTQLLDIVNREKASNAAQEAATETLTPAQEQVSVQRQEAGQVLEEPGTTGNRVGNQRSEEVTAQSVIEDALSGEVTEEELRQEYEALNAQEEAPDNVIQFPGSLPEGMGAASHTFDPYTNTMESKAGRQYNEAIDRYGAIQQGESPTNVVDVPKSTTGWDSVRKFARTYAESASMTDALMDRFVRDINSGLYSYSKRSLANVEDTVRRSFDALGYDGVLRQWNEVVQGTRRASDDDIAKAQALLAGASADGNTELAAELSAQIAAEGTALGRAVNAFRLLKRTTKEGRLYYINRVVQRINEKAYDDGKNFTVNIDGELAQALLAAETDAEVDAALDAIYDDVAQQIPSTISERINAWRYLAMLGNPRTHIRNSVGNVLFGQAVKSRDVVSAALQKVILHGGNKELINRAIRTDPAAKAFAKEDLKNVEAELGGNRYEDDMTEIQKRKRPLGKLQKVADFNEKAMTAEDMWAKKRAYVRVMANYLTAKGVDMSQEIPPNILMDARAHAIAEAKTCTFQDYSELAQHIRNVEDMNGASRILVGALMPFKKTPINITKQAWNFSPGGAVQGLVRTVDRVRKGDFTATEAIDQLAAGLTGTGIMGLGILLAKMGYIVAGGDDDKEGYLEDAEGLQEYSLVIPLEGGREISYTIDWAAPATIPLFIGAEAYSLKSAQGNTTVGEAVIDGVMRMFDPILEMTCMSGISSAIQGVAYNSDNPAYGFLTNAAQNYAGQFVPTLLSQVAKTADPVKRTTFYDESSKVPRVLQNIIQSNSNKIPGLSEKQPAALDVWGNQIERSDNPLVRAVLNFVSPGDMAEVKSSEVSDELRRLNDLGYEGMLPSELSKSSKLDDKRINAEQWTAWQTTKGQEAYKALQSIVGTEGYNALTDEEKADYIDKIFDLANETGKVAAGSESDDSSYNKAIESGYTDVGEIAKILVGKKKYDIDENDSYTQFELYDYISNTTDDAAEQEKMWNFLKDKGTTKSFAEIKKDNAPKLKAVKAAKSTLDNTVSAEKQSAFAEAVSGYNSQKDTKAALQSIDATDAERIAYYNFIKAKKGWKKTWYQVKK